MADSKRYQDESFLRQQYLDKRRTVVEIADACGVTPRTIQNWMDRFDIERRQGMPKKPWASFYTISAGYEEWKTSVQADDGREFDRCRVHQLLAVAEGYAPQKVFSQKYVVHHRNRVRWDNRPENIELMTNSDHTSMHRQEDG